MRTIIRELWNEQPRRIRRLTRNDWQTFEMHEFFNEAGKVILREYQVAPEYREHLSNSNRRRHFRHARRQANKAAAAFARSLPHAPQMASTGYGATVWLEPLPACTCHE